MPCPHVHAGVYPKVEEGTRSTHGDYHRMEQKMLQSTDNMVKDIGKNIGQIFRYILPGVVVLSSAAIARPHSFKWLIDWIEKGDPWHLVILGIIATVVGNVWLVFHRYVVHQLIDLVMYLIGLKGPSAGKRWTWGQYEDDLAKYVVQSHKIPQEDSIRQHVNLRASSMHLMYITVEVGFIFPLLAEQGSFFYIYGPQIWLLSTIGLVATLWQDVITRRIDSYSVESANQERKETPL